MVTVKDIAKICKVSPATVSKALNGYEDVNAQTAERIRQTARKLNYLPNAAARQLKTNISNNIGVLFFDETNSGLTHEYFSRILNSAKMAAEELGYDITFIGRSIVGRKGTFLEHARYRKVDGVLIASVDFKNENVRELVDSEIPTVTIDYNFPGHASVMSDNVEGGYALGRYLLELGHRRIGVIHGEMTSVTRKRLNGLYNACREYGVTIPEEYIVEGRYHDAKVSAEATKRLMELPDRPTAIMYPDDFAYLGGMAALENMGLSVPEDVSVTGYDGIPLGQVLRPKLTTYAQNAEEIGVQAANKLIRIIENKDKEKEEEISVRGRLVAGESARSIGVFH